MGEGIKGRKDAEVAEEPDYTQVRDDAIRGKICELMSEMFDNPDGHGVYPTSRFMWKMETYILGLLGARVKLGSRYRDKVHGVEGVATCNSGYLNGCRRACLEYVKEGEVKEYWVDQTQLEPVVEKEKAEAPALPKTGGPRSAPVGLSAPR